ncbi:LysR substrate-binding domain-containing protein [soil metagenome]
MSEGPPAGRRAPGGHPRRSLRVGLVRGVTADKWARRWAQRMPDHPLELVLVEDHEQVAVLRDGRVDMCFVRDPGPQDGLHRIPLYEEQPVVVVDKEHPVAAYDEIDVADLADETLLQDPDEVLAQRDKSGQGREGTRPRLPTTGLAQWVESVAAGRGIVIVPQSVARAHHRKDVVAVALTGVPRSAVGLSWPIAAADDLVEAFIGIVRGRTERSSRGGEKPRGDTQTGKQTRGQRS